MFTTKEGSTNCWFQAGSLGSTEFGGGSGGDEEMRTSIEEFELVGVMMGLAIYHSVTLAIPLPPVSCHSILNRLFLMTSPPQALYKKLCGEKLSLADLAPIDPVLEHGLRTLLEYEGDVEETFSRDFVVSEERFGVIVEHSLKEGGKDIAVTNENREGEFDATTSEMGRGLIDLSSRIRRSLRPSFTQHFDRQRVRSLRHRIQPHPLLKRRTLRPPRLRNRINSLRRIDPLLSYRSASNHHLRRFHRW